jgi:hypothetical protein
MYRGHSLCMCCVYVHTPVDVYPVLILLLLLVLLLLLCTKVICTFQACQSGHYRMFHFYIFLV